MPTSPAIKKLSRNNVARTIVCWFGAQYIRLVDITTSWTYGPEFGSYQHPLKKDIPFIACFWHGRLMMMGSNWSQNRPLYMLTSGHPDGKLIARIIQRLGFKTLEGSTNKGGEAAVRSMLRTLKGGGCVGFTPDGPRGPRMRARLGAIVLARLSGAPILPTTFSSTRRKIVKSWDRFFLARMFGRGVFLWGDPIWVPKDSNDAEMERFRQVLENSLNKLTKQADKFCGHPIMEPEPRANGQTTGSMDIRKSRE